MKRKQFNRRLKKFGISEQQYNLILKEQKGRCAVCGTSPEETGKTLAIDHCHTSGTVRGLLCSNCNNAAGLLKDSPGIAYSMCRYLEAAGLMKMIALDGHNPLHVWLYREASKGVTTMSPISGGVPGG